MTSPRLNATAVSLLGLLNEHGEMTGAELVRTAQERIGEFWTLTRSQVYRELGALADGGHVTTGERGPRDALPYRITPEGRKAFRSWLASEQPPETVRIGLLLIIAFGRHLPPGRLATLLDEHEARHRERLDGYAALAEHLDQLGADAYARATLSFGMHYEEAVLGWFATLPAELRGRADGS